MSTVTFGTASFLTVIVIPVRILPPLRDYCIMIYGTLILTASAEIFYFYFFLMVQLHQFPALFPPSASCIFLVISAVTAVVVMN